MASKSQTLRRDTLCWKCANATDSTKCPWVKDFTPVEGWDAEETKIWYNQEVDGKHYRKEEVSYIVKSCPLYEYENDHWVHIPSDERAKQIATSIILRGAQDYSVMKKKGKAPELKETTGEIVYKSDVIEFFRSKWIEILTGGVTSQRTAGDIRRELGIPDREEGAR